MLSEVVNPTKDSSTRENTKLLEPYNPPGTWRSTKARLERQRRREVKKQEQQAN